MEQTKEHQESGYLHRSYLRKSTREEIERITDKWQWKFRQDPTNYIREYEGKIRNGPLRDANTGKIIVGKPDIGHRSGYEERVMRECAERMHMSQKDYNNMMNNPKLYRFESREGNRGHRFEETDHRVQVSRAMRTINHYMDAKQAEKSVSLHETKPMQDRTRNTAAAKDRVSFSASHSASHSARTSHDGGGNGAAGHGVSGGKGSLGSGFSGGHPTSGSGHTGASGSGSGRNH